jgi:hypothetical protein
MRHNLSYHVYADDTQIYLAFKPSQQQSDLAIKCLENCVSDIRVWMKQNFLKLNDNKTQFMFFGSYQQLAKIPSPNIIIGETHIESLSKARNLGVIFDSCMTMKSHISNITRTPSFHLRNIGKLRRCLDSKAAEQIIHSFVTSRLDMGNSLLVGLPQKQIHRLQLLQNTAARIVTLSKKSCHITPILKDLHWLPVSYRIMYKIALIVYKSMNDSAPSYISDLLQLYVPIRNLRSIDKLLLRVPRSYHTWGDRSFAVAAPRLWNSLPLHIRASKSVVF